MTPSRRLRRLLLEGLPASTLVVAASIVAGLESFAWAVVVPVGLVIGVGIIEAAMQPGEAREAETGPAVAARHGALVPLLSVARTYAHVGLWRQRGVYDASAAAALILAVAWCVLLTTDDPAVSTARLFCVLPLVVAAGGLWLRVLSRRSAA